jgi:UDP-N-acetylmuramate dehydrogenase
MSGYLLRENAPLQARNTFRVAASAALLADVRNPESLAELFAFPYVRSHPVLLLGEGSNLLFAGDFDGVVVSLPFPGIRILEDHGDDGALVRAEAGERWDDLVRWSVCRGFHGFENLALIPGSVGASPIQNIGAYGVEVGEFIAGVEAFDRDAGQLVRIERADCAFGYRDSIFRRSPERWAITAVEFLLPRRRELRLDYAGVREELKRMGVETPRPPHVAEAISRIRTAKLPNPALIGNAGSFFKNPQLPAAEAEAMRSEHAALPVFPAFASAQAKLSAAWLIEHCGWKGHRDGDAGVSDAHALVLVNHGTATGAQILDLARRIADSVQQRFGIALEPEPRIIGATWR